MCPSNRVNLKGRAFEAIIEDEYRELENDVSRALYAATSCFYRHRALVRDQVLAQMLDTNLADLYQATSAATEGVIVFETADEAQQTYVARARHHKIAEIVWERMLEISERESIMQRGLSALNLTFGPDSKAFDLLVRSDLSESFKSLEGKVRFFDEACQKDPRSEYVRQHYARMLRSEKLYDAALAQIEVAIKMAPRTRVLYHTKGLILSDLTFVSTSADIARKRLAQAEGCFRETLSMYARDQYAFHGLARLYLGWAKRAASDEESVGYLSKAEAVITEGLRKAVARESLFIVSSEVKDYLGDRPGAVSSLQQAIQANPGASIARYILARHRMVAQDYEATIEVLQPNLLQNPEDPRSALLFALALEAQGKSYREAIAVLEQASLYGAKDPFFVATLSGMHFMNGDFTRSEALLQESLKQQFTYEERLRVSYTPRAVDNPSQYVRLEGEVIAVKAGYVFLEGTGYPRFFCHSTKYGNVVMNQGIRVLFTPGFSLRGPTAVVLGGVGD